MKKILIVAMVALSMFSMKTAAQSVGTGATETPDLKHMSYIITLLEKVEGSVFLTPGEPRDLSDIFTRTDEVLPDMNEGQVQDMEWYSYDTNIAKFPWYEKDKEGVENKIEAKTPSEIWGLNFGETIIRGSKIDRKTNTIDEHYFLAFVCPTITVVSPDGAIYRHQKVFNQKARVNFTQSNKYVLNTVQLYKGDNAEPEDITDLVAPDPNDTDNENGTDGYFETQGGVVENMKFVLSMESITDDYEGGVIGNSNLKVYVQGKTVKFVQTDGNHNIAMCNVEIYSIKKIPDTNGLNEKLYDGNPQATSDPSVATITFNESNAGVFFIKVEGYTPVYKIVME